jgi:hypothetical protein
MVGARVVVIQLLVKVLAHQVCAENCHRGPKPRKPAHPILKNLTYKWVKYKGFTCSGCCVWPSTTGAASKHHSILQKVTETRGMYGGQNNSSHQC